MINFDSDKIIGKAKVFWWFQGNRSQLIHLNLLKIIEAKLGDYSL